MVDDDIEVYDKYRDELMRFASAIVGPSAAEDVVANAVIRAFASRGWTSVSSARPYLYRAVINEAHSIARSTQRRLRREARVAPSELVDGQMHLRPGVLLAIRRLSLRQRAVVFLTYWQDLEATEVGVGLGVSTPLNVN